MNTQPHTPLDDLGLPVEMKQSPFDTPPLYFEKLADNVMPQIHRKPIKLEKPNFFKHFAQQFVLRGAAFGVGMIVLCAVIFWPMLSESNSQADILLSEADVEAYYQEFELTSDEEIASIDLLLDDISPDIIQAYLDESFFYGDSDDDDLFELL